MRMRVGAGRRKASRRSQWMFLIATFSCIFLVTSCGGGTMMAEGGVGTGGTGVVMGTVTGFGSIIVDGLHLSSVTGQYETDSNLAPEVLTSPQRVALGQNIQVQLDAQGNPAKVQLEPQLVGQVTANPKTNTLVVNGLTVLLNTSDQAAPTTVLEGYASFTNIQVGDWVCIYGSPGYDASQSPFLQATSIRQIPANPGYLRVSGPVAGLANGTFTVNNLTFSYGSSTSVLGAVSQPGGMLENGEWVNVWSNATTTPWSVGQVRVQTLSGVSGTVTLSGVVSQLSNGQWFVDGLPVSLSTGLSSLVTGEYVTVEGVVDSLGILNAQRVTPYIATADPIQLAGTIAELASSGNFTVRGTVVVVNSNTQIHGPSGTPLALSAVQENAYVQVQGIVTGNVVQASSIIISSSVPIGAVVDYLGTVLSMSNNQVTLTLLDGNSEQVTLPSTVVYANGTASNLLPGALVSVEGSATGANAMDAVGVNFWRFANGSSPQPSSIGFQASGPVYNYQSTTQTFDMNGLSIQIGSGATLPPGFSNGMSVDVLLTLTNGQLSATAIYPDDSL